MITKKFFKVPSISASKNNEILRVYETSNFPILVERVFTVTASNGSHRGLHAHRLCTQILSCVSGAIDLILDDGSRNETVHLTPNSDAVLIPPGTWAEQKYLKDYSVLLVLCDQSYDKGDYIRNYDEFIDFKRNTR